MSLIALEEHYAWDPASSGNVVATWLHTNDHVAYERLYDRGPLRLEQMDAAHTALAWDSAPPASAPLAARPTSALPPATPPAGVGASARSARASERRA